MRIHFKYITQRGHLIYFPPFFLDQNHEAKICFHRINYYSNSPGWCFAIVINPTLSMQIWSVNKNELKAEGVV